MRNTEKYSISYASAELPRVTVSFEGVETLTHQDQMEQTDINNIVRDYAMNGRVTVGAAKQPQFGDFSQVKSYEDALTYIRDAEMAFMDLPSELRKEYDNDAAKWVEAQLQAAQDAAEEAKAEQEAAELAEKEESELRAAQELVAKSGATDAT